MAFAAEQGISPVEAMLRTSEIAGLTGKARGTAFELGRLILRLAEEAEALTVTELAQAVMDETGYRRNWSKRGQLKPAPGWKI